MTSRKAKGDAGEAAYAAYVEANGGRAFPLSPSFPSADLLVLTADHSIEFVEVKAWKRPINPETIAHVEQTLLALRRALPDRWRRRVVSLVLVHAVKGDDGGWRFAETWRFP